MSTNPCGALWPTDRLGHYPCIRPKGHPSIHMNRDYDTWSNDMTQCAEVNDENHRCKLAHRHDGPCRFVSVRTAEPRLDEGTYLIPATMPGNQCGAQRREVEDQWPCIRPKDHTGGHVDKDGDHWSFPMLLEEMCGADIGGDTARACRLDTDHDGEHSDDDFYGRPTEDIIREMAERLTRLEERQSRVEENADRVVKIAENLRVRGDGFEHGLGHALREIIELLSERLPEPPSPRCGEPSPGSGTDLCDQEKGHDGRHRHGTWTWPRGDGPQLCPATLSLRRGSYECILHLDHEGLHMDSDNDTWGITGL